MIIDHVGLAVSNYEVSKRGTTSRLCHTRQVSRC
jgi:hypothetical protein